MRFFLHFVGRNVTFFVSSTVEVSKDHASTSTSESGLVWRKGAPNSPDAAHLILRKEDKGLLSRILLLLIHKGMHKFAV